MTLLFYNHLCYLHIPKAKFLNFSLVEFRNFRKITQANIVPCSSYCIHLKRWKIKKKRSQTTGIVVPAQTFVIVNVRIGSTPSTYLVLRALCWFFSFYFKNNFRNYLPDSWPPLSILTISTKNNIISFENSSLVNRINI